ncbi:MAG: group II intron reverse transcriptase/maturase [Selenomonadaceae bacterium]|nr:group II intron reverse transcriptase/maturase [Selenomonadaceae bacterium]
MPKENIYNELYERAKNGEHFTNLMPLVLSMENILLAYRNIKDNAGSNTAGTDKLTIADIGKMTPEEVTAKVRYIVSGTKHGYRPKPVRRKEISKPNGSSRPLGIPCIWDRLIQQCLKQVLEPICEVQFSKHSYGFRPNCSVENAIADAESRMQRGHLHYVIEFDIKGFFDNVNHSKLMRQMWTLGIRDKHLLGKILRILKAPIKMPNGELKYPTKGTPQGGIISPLLANIVLNELDHWVESNWEENPIVYKYSITKNGTKNGYRAMRKTKLKEMYIVRYADDFRIFCRTKTTAEKTKIAITQWLFERLKLEVSQEKTKVVNIKRRYSEFLGFKIKVHSKGGKQVVKSHISDKQLKTKKKALLKQVKRIARPKTEKEQLGEIWQYNKMVMGMQNYYRLATNISVDAGKLSRAVMTVIINRLKGICKKGRKLTPTEKVRYGKSAMIRYLAGEPIYPIGYVQHKIPMNKSYKTSTETVDEIKLKLLRQPLYSRSIEYADNRISLYSAQKGTCAVTGEKFTSTDKIHCHHKIPKSKGGTDDYQNLILVTAQAHKLIHATNLETIQCYLQACKPDIKKLNVLRKMVGNNILSVD